MRNGLGRRDYLAMLLQSRLVVVELDLARIRIGLDAATEWVLE
jgi:hypothetical protein